MRSTGLQGVHRRKLRGCTRRDQAATPSDDLVERNFQPAAPERLYGADITQHRTSEGWFYLAVVLDCFSRRVVGWAMADHIRSELVVDALQARVARRLTLHLPRAWPWEQQWTELFTRTCGPPRTATS